MSRFPLGRFRLSGFRIPRPGFAMGIWLTVPVLVLLLVWQQASTERLVVDLEKQRDARRELESQVNALRLEANKLSSLGQVESRAERELGLMRPDTDQIVHLVFSTPRDDRVFGIRSLITDANAGPRRRGEHR